MFAPNSKPIQDMTDREIAEETLYWLRKTGEALAAFQEQGVASIMGQLMRGIGGGRRQS